MATGPMKNIKAGARQWQFLFFTAGDLQATFGLHTNLSS